jgi:superfamily I DNA and RNA helicase
VPEPPLDAGVILFETIRRFKGLERPVIVLCELPAEGTRLDALLYTALTRSTTHVVVIAPPALAARLQR